MGHLTVQLTEGYRMVATRKVVREERSWTDAQ
jgi:hypothetical protein